MDSVPPTWAIWLFASVNIVISITYGLLAFYFARHIRLPNKTERNPLTIIASIAAALFFLGCVLTHAELAYWALTKPPRAYWSGWLNIASDTLQAIGGLVFWILAWFFLQLNIFDKRHYDKITGGEDSVR